jgi:transcriptional regulator with XRE-family HTH domain
VQNKQVALRIKERAKRCGVSVTALLVELSISKSLIYDLEKRGAVPSAEVFEKLAGRLSCSVDYLLNLTDNPDINR